MVKVALDQFSLADNQYQQKFEVLYTFTSSKSSGYLLKFEPSSSVFLKFYKTESDDITITFTDQNGGLLEIKYKVYLTLLIDK